jgi:hypothetical protein
VKIKLSGWIRQGNRGEFISIKYDDFKPAHQERQYSAPRQAPKPPQTFDDMDDSIPF